MNPTILVSTLAAMTIASPIGDVIYEGRVFAPKALADAAPPFTYERRVAATDQGLAAAHITRDARGEPIISESAQMSPDYRLQRFDATNRQQGYSGSVTVSPDGRRLDYRLLRDGEVKTASETIADPVVAGPSLHGFILQHWDALRAGETVRVRMIVLAKTTSYGFLIRRQVQAGGTTAFSLTPTNWLVRLAVAPLTVSFDTATRQLVRYDGRVPPVLVADGKARDFDARVEYTMKAPAYR